MMRSLAIIFIVILVSILNISGQVRDIPLTEPGELSLKIKNINFVKNNEYFNPIVEGYTLVGYFFHPELVYSPSKKVNLRLGSHILSYAGTEKFSQFKPVFATSLNFSDNTSLTIGTLNGSDSHKMLDPHFDGERFYREYSEDGLQFTSSNNYFFTDTWLSWENFIFAGDSTREIFTAGESFKYTSPVISGSFQMEIPVQLQFKHYGGQISNYTEEVETYFNFATGIRLNLDLAGKRYGQAGIEYLQFINNELSSDADELMNKGHAAWFRLHYTYKSLYLGVAYFKSHNYFSPNGNAIYSSVSHYQEDIVIPDRKILTNYLSLTAFPVSYLEVFLGLETYYDIDLKRLDHALSLHLNFDKLIKLATLKH